MTVDATLLCFYLEQHGVDLQIEHAASRFGDLLFGCLEFLAHGRVEVGSAESLTVDDDNLNRRRWRWGCCG